MIEIIHSIKERAYNKRATTSENLESMRYSYFYQIRQSANGLQRTLVLKVG